MTKTVEIFVIEQSEAGNSIKCSTSEDGSNAFYLPKSQIKPYGSVRKNTQAKFDIPDWLWRKHRQLCGDEIFEEEKRRNKGD